MRPAGRIITCMPFVLEIVVVFRGNDLLALMLNFQAPGGMGQVMSCGLQVRVELKHSKTQTLKHFSVPFSGLYSRAAQCASRDVGYYTKNFGRAGSSFRGSQKIGEKGGVERKLALALVRSFFALSIRDNYLLFSLSTLGSYHWLRTRRLLRLQKTNSSLAPLPLRFAAFSRRSTGREKPPRPWGWG